ncbi:MAG: PEP-CTERM sorting domain-containing protein [Pseudomonadota bacterium]|nr:PEP-CTERM sorting domain-containing protein [Pseudomonadota bacterium]
MPNCPTLRIAAAAAALCCALPAIAEPITPYNDAFLAWHSPDVQQPEFFDTQSARQLQTNGALPTAATQYSGSGNWGSVGALASADLASGQLKVQATANFISPPDNLLYVQTNARFGDGFRTTTPNGSPFTWVPGQGARFSMHVDGELTSTQALQVGNGGAFLILSLFQPGTLTTEQNGISGPNILRSYTYLLGNADQNLVSCFQGVCVPIIPEAAFLDLSNGVDILQDINPGGDFDWQVILGSSGSQYVPGSFNFDLSHTVTVGYNGPAGAVTQSVSGLFGNIGDALPVPEPGTLLLVLPGLAAVGVRRRHRG